MPLASWAKLGIPYWQMGYEKRFTSSDITVLGAILIWVCIRSMTCSCLHFLLQQVTEMYCKHLRHVWKRPLEVHVHWHPCEVLHHTSPWRRSCVQSSWPGTPSCQRWFGWFCRVMNDRMIAHAGIHAMRLKVQLWMFLRGNGRSLTWRSAFSRCSTVSKTHFGFRVSGKGVSNARDILYRPARRFTTRLCWSPCPVCKGWIWLGGLIWQSRVG